NPPPKAGEGAPPDSPAVSALPRSRRPPPSPRSRGEAGRGAPPAAPPPTAAAPTVPPQPGDEATAQPRPRARLRHARHSLPNMHSPPMAGFIVGLTGGVASGKSEVARCFEALGVTVVDADAAAREAVAVGSEGLGEVVAAFGPEVLAPDGSLDRPAMRRRVFADDAARAQLEAIVHPRVRALLRTACEAAPGPYAMAAIPLLAEAATASGSGVRTAYPWLHRVLVVD